MDLNNSTNLIISKLNNTPFLSMEDNLIISYFDQTSQIISLLIHSGYFLIAFFVKCFHGRTHIYLHHVNVISLLYVIHFMFYFGSRSRSIKSSVKPEFLCTLSELSWSILKYLRMFSLTLLAVYRYWAVFKMKFYKKLNSKKFSKNLFSSGLKFILNMLEFCG